MYKIKLLMKKKSMKMMSLDFQKSVDFSRKSGFQLKIMQNILNLNQKCFLMIKMQRKREVIINSVKILK